ncbi:MAG: tRNA pseudouridine(38-40) synthase TruA [Kiritimatiellae bacterium]|jgi:tRNA pseudouridine38-40 synthase|nr:tRNA pseudouridine(38-40) synthase TruA [Kiritimatiellia bacterium]
MKMRRIKINISYDGTDYSGWQVQPNRASIQEKIETTLLILTSESIRIHGSGRTDAGVHAKAQIAHFDMEKTFPNDKLKLAMNSLLPPDIRINSVTNVKTDFHARYDVQEKEYHYFIYNGSPLSPFDEKYKVQIQKKLNIDAMQKAATYLVGKHDFASFTANAGKKLETTIRNVTALQVIKSGKNITIVAKSQGFLYKMVRSIAGYLIRVGLEEVSPELTKDILEMKTRVKDVKTAPAKGLFLWNVKY